MRERIQKPLTRRPSRCSRPSERPGGSQLHALREEHGMAVNALRELLQSREDKAGDVPNSLHTRRARSLPCPFKLRQTLGCLSGPPPPKFDSRPRGFPRQVYESASLEAVG
jgi:hypothetical protein